MEQFYFYIANESTLSLNAAVRQARKALYARGTAHFLTLFENTRDDHIKIAGHRSNVESKPYVEPRNNLAGPLGIYNLLVGRKADLYKLPQALASNEEESTNQLS